MIDAAIDGGHTPPSEEPKIALQTEFEKLSLHDD
jgi:hypothetical protein